jgi:Tfp pilus assembly protein PilN
VSTIPSRETSAVPQATGAAPVTAVASLDDRVRDLQRTVDKLNLIMTIIAAIAGLFAVMIVGGVITLISTISRYEVQIANLAKQLDKVDERLESFERGEGPLGAQIKRLQDQVDALQKERPSAKGGP